MEKDFDIIKWNLNKTKLIKKYPQLTDADLIWRHETKNDLIRSIADKLGLTKKGLEEIIENN